MDKPYITTAGCWLISFDEISLGNGSTILEISKKIILYVEREHSSNV